jgi:VCBS repeat-containing protein
VNTAVEDGSVVTGQLTETDSDASDTHTYALISNTAEGSATVNPDGSYSFDPGADFQDLAVGETRDVTFVYEVTDNNNATSQATVTITVSGTNDGPVAQSGVNTAVEDGSVVTGQLSETDADTSDTHTYALISNTSEGSATVNPDGSYSFDPGTDFQDLAVGETRDVTFVYEVEDNNGATSQETVTITVSGTNDGPVALAGVNVATEDGAIVNGTLMSTDADASDAHSYSLITDTAEGSVTVNADGSYTFDPGADFQDLAVGETRDVTFVYEVEDNNRATSQETVVITVSGTNDGPVASNDQARTDEDQSIVVDVLQNDFDADASDQLTLVSAEIVGGLGSVAVVDGRLVYNPGEAYQHLSVGEHEDVTITYQIRDAQGSTTEGSLTVQVDGNRDAFLVDVPDLRAEEDQAIAWPIRLTAIDIRGEAPTGLSVVGLPHGSRLSDSLGNHMFITQESPAGEIVDWDLASLSVTPPTSFSGVVDFEVRLTTSNASNVDQVHVTRLNIAPLADVAILVVQSAAGQQDSAIPLSIRAQLVDTDGSETLQLEVDRIPVGARLTDGTNTFQATTTKSRTDISSWNIEALRLIPPSGSDADIVLNVIATTTETNGDQAVVTSGLEIDVRQVVATVVAGPTAVVTAEETQRDAKVDAAVKSPSASTTTGSDDTTIVDQPVVKPAGTVTEVGPANEGQPYDLFTTPKVSWRDVLAKGGPDYELDLRPVEPQPPVQPTSGWRVQPLSVLENAVFVPVAIDPADAKAMGMPVTVAEPELDLPKADAEAAAPASQAKQTFGLLWALVRSLSGTIDTNNTPETVKPEAVKPSRSGRNK